MKVVYGRRNVACHATYVQSLSLFFGDVSSRGAPREHAGRCLVQALWCATNAPVGTGLAGTWQPRATSTHFQKAVSQDILDDMTRDSAVN